MTNVDKSLSHRENVSDFINNWNGRDFDLLKRILLYIVKHVRFQDDKKV